MRSELAAPLTTSHTQLADGYSQVSAAAKLLAQVCEALLREEISKASAATAAAARSGSSTAANAAEKFSRLCSGDDLRGGGDDEEDEWEEGEDTDEDGSSDDGEGAVGDEQEGQEDQVRC